MNKNNYKNFSKFDNEDIDLNRILRFFLRNIKSISYTSLIFFVLFCFYSLIIKRTWEGQFQIVLKSQDETKKVNFLDPNLSAFIGDVPGNDLKTEVGILESPSLLMPIFDYVVKEKQKNNKNQKLDFNLWEENLEIKLQKGTSIVNISYRDKDKKLIIPVLEKMSFAYQEYSGSDKKRSQFLLNNYLDKQISIFKEKSSESLKAAQSFAIDQDLVFFNNPFQIDIPLEDKFLPSNIGIENIRLNALNRIKFIDLQLKKINEIGDDTEKLQYIGSTLPSLVEEGLPAALMELEQEIIEARTKYTESDRTILNLLDKRELLIRLLKGRAIGILEAEKLEEKSKMEAAMRPKGVLLKYKELIRNAQRDEKALIGLEEELMRLKLEESMFSDPWELITQPTLLKKPFAPSRRKIGLIGLFLGLFSGTLYSLYKENKLGYIYESETLENIFLAPVIGKINIEEKDKDIQTLKFLREFLKNNSPKKICFLSCTDIDKVNIKNIESLIINSKSLNDIANLDFVFKDDDLEKFTSADIKFLIISLSSARIDEMKKLQNNLKIIDSNFNGIILI